VVVDVVEAGRRIDLDVGHAAERRAGGRGQRRIRRLKPNGAEGVPGIAGEVVEENAAVRVGRRGLGREVEDLVDLVDRDAGEHAERTRKIVSQQYRVVV
jgi:hypothetical protein